MKAVYNTYTSSDFLTDDAFVGHQLSPTQATSNYWQAWLDSKPENLAEWEHAIYLLDAIRLGLNDYASTYLSEEVIEELLTRIKNTNGNTEPVPVKKLHISLKWLVAASILIATVTGSFFWKSNHQKSDYNVHVAQLKSEFMEKVNTSAKVEIIVLPDSTTVALFPASKLSYGQDFNTTHRTIYLSGEASFDVKRNIKKPFLVYANKVVTKVLGTQFVVRAYDNEMDVKVNVKSGQVSVYREAVDDTKEIVSKKSNKGLLLLPNQQAVFSRKSEEFNKTLVEKPEILIPIEEPTFVYDEVAISKVFRDIETAYGITIRYNQESLAGCQLSASLNRESFDQKLDIICKTVKASYQKFDGQIIINGGSCE